LEILLGLLGLTVLLDDFNESLLRQIQQFKRCRLKQAETTVTTEDGCRYVEQLDKMTGKVRLLRVDGDGSMSAGFVADLKPDLQVGHIQDRLLLG